MSLSTNSIIYIIFGLVSIVHSFSKFLTLLYFGGQLYYSVCSSLFWRLTSNILLAPPLCPSAPSTHDHRGTYPWGKMLMQWKKHELGDKRDLVLNFQIYSLLVEYDLGQEINPLNLSFLIYEMGRIIHTQ